MARLPSKTEIEQRAKELWHETRFRKGDPSFSIEPELEELREEGFLSAAQSELMRDQHRAQVESDFIDYPEKFSVDLEEALKSGIYVCGTTGSGKSDIGMYVASLLMKEGVTVIVFDPTQDWQQRSSIPNYVKIEQYLHDIPNKNMIYDISEMTINKQQKLVEDFCNKIMTLQAIAKNIHGEPHNNFFLIFEEAHTYFPEGCMRAKRYQNTVKMMTQGRNFNVRFMCITQFSSLIDKQAMRYMKQRYFGFSDERNDTNYIGSFVGKENIGIVKTLEAGQFLYYNRGRITKVEIEPFTTKKKPKKLEVVEPKPIEPIKPKQHHDKILGSLILLAIWVPIIMIAISHKTF